MYSFPSSCAWLEWTMRDRSVSVIGTRPWWDLSMSKMWAGWWHQALVCVSWGVFHGQVSYVLSARLVTDYLQNTTWNPWPFISLLCQGGLAHCQHRTAENKCHQTSFPSHFQWVVLNFLADWYWYKILKWELHVASQKLAFCTEKLLFSHGKEFLFWMGDFFSSYQYNIYNLWNWTQRIYSCQSQGSYLFIPRSLKRNFV